MQYANVLVGVYLLSKVCYGARFCLLEDLKYIQTNNVCYKIINSTKQIINQKIICLRATGFLE
jgi:hypothetical protein